MASPLSDLVWSVADLLRGDHKQSDYGKVILPFTLLRRLDCVLEPTKDAVLAACEGFFGRLKNEMYYNRNWSTASTVDFMKQIDDYIRWYNLERIKMSLGAMSPVEYRVSLGLAA